MSDHARSGASSDRLNDTLTTLRTDVDGLPLADSAAVRRRGNQRTRRQAVGSSLAVVALVAGAVGISGALMNDENKAQQLPSEEQTISTTQEPTPDAPVETREPVERIGADVLLTVQDMPPVPNQTFIDGETHLDMTAAAAQEQGLLVCGAASVGSAQTTVTYLRTFPSELDAFAWQSVAQYVDASSATAAFGELTGGCSNTNGDVAFVDGDKTTFRSTLYSADPDSEYYGEETGIALRGDTVVVFTLRGNFREGDIDEAAFDDTFLLGLDAVADR